MVATEIVLDEPILLPNESLTALSRIDQIERTILTLDKRISAIHELVERVIEANVLLKRQAVPTYDQDQVEKASIAAGIVPDVPVPKKVQLVRTADGRIDIKGRVYDIKDDLKSMFSCMWNVERKSWSCDASRLAELEAYLQAKAFVVAMS